MNDYDETQLCDVFDRMMRECNNDVDHVAHAMHAFIDAYANDARRMTNAS